MIVLKESQRFFTYRTNIIAGCLGALFMLGARFALWTALFETGNAQEATLIETMTFFVIMDIMSVWVSSRYGDMLGADVKSGDIAGRLIRPYPYHLQLLASFHAEAATATLIRALPMLIVTLIFIGMLPPVSLAAFFFFILSALFGAAIYTLVDLIIGYTVFWVNEFWFIAWFKRALFNLFGGLILPLWFYPDWLRTFSDFLPFQHALFTPISIYLGRIQPENILFAFGMQLFWIAVLFLCERAVWRLAQYKMIVQGG